MRGRPNKLTEAQEKDICARYALHKENSTELIAARYKINANTVLNIWHRRNRKPKDLNEAKYALGPNARYIADVVGECVDEARK